MKTVTAVLLCMGSLSFITAAPVARENGRYEYNYEKAPQQRTNQAQDTQESASHYDEYIQDVKAAANGGGGKKGFSQGSGLRTIAVGSANQAKTALGNQVAAGLQAAYVAKNTLAQSAAQSSATAQAALAGKQVILSGLEQQVRDAKVGLQGEEMQLQQAKRAAQAAAQAAQQAMHQVNVIQAALNAAQATSENANEAASQAAGELGAQTAMVGAARQRLSTLQEQLRGVRIDFEATQAAARKAQAAAQQAQANAAEAAAKAAAAGLAANKPDATHEEPPKPSKPPKQQPKGAKLTITHQDTAKPNDQPEKPRTIELNLSSHPKQNHYAAGKPAKAQSHSDPKSEYIIFSPHVESPDIIEIKEEVSLTPHDSHSEQPATTLEIVDDNSDEVESNAEPVQKQSYAEDDTSGEVEIIEHENVRREPNQNQYESLNRNNNEYYATDNENNYESENSDEHKQDLRHNEHPEHSGEVLTDSEQHSKRERPTRENYIKLEDADSFDQLFPENYVNLNSYYNGDKKKNKNSGFYNKW